MKFLVGLGNPEESFARTRHNAGFIFLDWLAKDFGAKFSFQKKINSLIAKPNSQLILCKPQTYMNRSGLAVQTALNYYGDGSTKQQLCDLVVIHDDLDLSLGKYKLQFGTGPKKHNGLLSIYEQLGSDQFWHLRIGIDHRGDLRRNIPGENYVLQDFPPLEQAVIIKALPSIYHSLATKLELS